MSRIGKKPTKIPEKVKVNIDGLRKISVEGPKGKLEWIFPKEVTLKMESGEIHIKRLGENKIASSMHGLTKRYIDNMIKGVTEGYVKTLEIHGVGYRAQVTGRDLNLLLGFSHPVVYPIPEGISIKTEKPNKIIVEGIDKAKVGEVASEIRDFFKPEPYKGKGIRYEGEFVRKKAGKAVA